MLTAYLMFVGYLMTAAYLMFTGYLMLNAYLKSNIKPEINKPVSSSEPKPTPNPYVKGGG